MGRPLNKRYFGPPSASGNEIKVQFHNGTASVNGWIVKQKGSKRFLCTNGTVSRLCKLSTKASNLLLAGEMSITVKTDAATVLQVTKISSKKVTLENGTVIAWNWSTSTSDGKVEMEEAGDDTVITSTSTDEDDFEADDPAP
jgi:hypothetical protein